ncbi:hypothetical protein D019_2910 [Vibrio parahaemolyticus VP2007-095]|nr:hypothetical protein D019_2910 [Vibrio parahaemolyticus VP2007-095]
MGKPHRATLGQWHGAPGENQIQRSGGGYLIKAVGYAAKATTPTKD